MASAGPEGGSTLLNIMIHLCAVGRKNAAVPDVTGFTPVLTM
jgi:hypothetical protein